MTVQQSRITGSRTIVRRATVLLLLLCYSTQNNILKYPSLQVQGDWWQVYLSHEDVAILFVAKFLYKMRGKVTFGRLPLSQENVLIGPTFIECVSPEKMNDKYTLSQHCFIYLLSWRFHSLKKSWTISNTLGMLASHGMLRKLMATPLYHPSVDQRSCRTACSWKHLEGQGSPHPLMCVRQWNRKSSKKEAQPWDKDALLIRQNTK